MISGHKVHIMNVYTKDVYICNYHYIYNYRREKLKKCSNEINHFRKNKKVCTVVSHFILENKHIDFLRDDKNIDLCILRCDVALYGNSINSCDLYGKGWPAHVTTGILIERKKERDDSEERKDKIKLLRNYNFNLCFENTIAENYVTEKFWDSIYAHCLPIYFGRGSGIYDDFPKDSFIDYSQFGSPQELYTFIDKLTFVKYKNRLNKCIDAFNSCVLGEKGNITDRKRIQNLADKINLIMHN